MAPKRSTPQPPTNNAPKPKRRELTPFLRGIIVGKLLEGKRPTDIAQELQIPPQTVYTTKRNLGAQVDGESKPRSGRPLSYTDRDARHVCAVVRREPGLTCDRIRERCGLKVSDKIIRKILRERGIERKRGKGRGSRRGGQRRDPRSKPAKTG